MIEHERPDGVCVCLSGIFRCPYPCIFEIPRMPVPLGVLVSVINATAAATVRRLVIKNM